MPLEITVVNNTRDNTQQLFRLLDSLEQQTYTKECYDIIVADDSESNETARLFNERPMPVVPTFFQSDKGRGRQYGRNQAFKNSEAGTLLFLDDTCIAPATLLEEHVNAHKQFKRTIVRGPLISQRGDSIKEITGSFRAPQLDFTMINASIPKLCLAQVGHMREDCAERFLDTDVYWPLMFSRFKEKFISKTYCFQDSRYYQDLNVSVLKKRADRMASSAVDFYFHDPKKEMLEFLRGFKVPLDTIQEMLAMCAPSADFTAALISGKLEGRGFVQSKLMEVVYHYHFKQKLISKLKTYR